jgi:RHS repeat-associated protein
MLDDLMFSAGKLKRSYQVIPGAAIGGVLGSQTGPNVVAENGQTRRYFHYNDLGTVMAQTKQNGTWEGVWEPDHFGNYRYKWSTSPARPELGLTGKMWDASAGLYYFNARWLDPERGRWVSEEPTGADGLNLYSHCDNDGLNWYDPDGEKKRPRNPNYRTPGNQGKPGKPGGKGPKPPKVRPPTTPSPPKSPGRVRGVLGKVRRIGTVFWRVPSGAVGTGEAVASVVFCRSNTSPNYSFADCLCDMLVANPSFRGNLDRAVGLIPFVDDFAWLEEECEGECND